MRPIPATSLGHSHGLLRAIEKRGRLRTDEFVTEFSLEELFPPDLENALGRLRHFISYARAAGLVKEDRGVVELTEIGRRYVRAGDADRPFDIAPQQAEWLRRQLRELHMTDSIYHGLAIGISLLASCPPGVRVSTLDFGRSMGYLGRAGWDNENTLQIQGERYLQLLQDMEMIDEGHRVTPTGEQVRSELTLPVHMSLMDIAGQQNPGGPDAVRADAEREWAQPAAAAPDTGAAPQQAEDEDDEDYGYQDVGPGQWAPSEPEPVGEAPAGQAPVGPSSLAGVVGGPSPSGEGGGGDPVAPGPPAGGEAPGGLAPGQVSVGPPAGGDVGGAAPGGVVGGVPGGGEVAGGVAPGQVSLGPPAGEDVGGVAPGGVAGGGDVAGGAVPGQASVGPPGGDVVSGAAAGGAPASGGDVAAGAAPGGGLAGGVPGAVPGGVAGLAPGGGVAPGAVPGIAVPGGGLPAGVPGQAPGGPVGVPSFQAGVGAPQMAPAGPAFVGAGAIRAAGEAAGLRLPDSVYVNVAAALAAGKHLLLTGAPGAGKTSLAMAVARAAAQGGRAHGATVVTAAPGWAPQALLIEAATRGRWVIADELDRADLDEAIGALSSFLAGVPVAVSGAQEAAPADGWRIVATWGGGTPSASAAILRRFAVVDVIGPPADDLRAALHQAANGDVNAAHAAERLLQLADLAPLGAGVFLDAARHAAARRSVAPVDDLTLAREAYATYVAPLLGELDEDGERRVRELLG